MNLTESERAWLKVHPQVRWGIDPCWPPFSSFNRRDELEGIDADISRLVAKRVGVRLTVVRAASWSELFEKAKAGEVDFLSGTARTVERSESFAYSDEYGRFPVVIVTRDTGPFLTSILDLKSMTIAEPRDYVITRQLEKDLPNARMILTDTAEDALGFVARGKADVTIENLAVATRAVRIDGLTNLKISGVTHYEFPLHFAVRKDAPELVSILNKGLRTITGHEAEMIYAAHLTPDIAKARNWSLWRRRALYSILIGAPIIASLLCWNRCLISQVRRRKAAESALLEARDRLEQRTRDLDLRVAEVERLNVDLHAVNQDVEAFSSSASHDLRGPLRRMNAFAEMVRAESANSLTAESRQWLGIIISESKRLDKLIHDLLEFARLGRAELHKQPVNMVQLVNEIISEFRPQLQNREVIWRVGALGTVLGDHGLLHQAATNLIDNALKYTRRSSQARITIDVLPDGSTQHEAVFYVKDNGCGFDPKGAAALCTPFQRLHSNKEYEGTGIGLANVKKIIQKHDGRFWFESQPNRGATFFFALPAAVSP